MRKNTNQNSDYSKSLKYYDKFYNNLVRKYEKQVHLNEIIEPYLDYKDSNTLGSTIRNQMFNKFEKVKFNVDDQVKSVSELSNVFKRSIINDIFNANYAHPDDFVINYEKDPMRAKVLNKLINYQFRIVTADDPITSYYMTEGIIEYILTSLKKFIEENNMSQEDINDMMSMLSGDSGSNSQKAEANLSKFLDGLKGSSIEDIHLNALDEAGKAKSDMQSLGSGSDMSQGFGISEGISHIKNYNTIKDYLKNLKISKSDKFINKILNSSLSGLETKLKREHLDLHEVSNFHVDDISGLQFFNKQLNNLFIDDISVRKNKKSGKIDLYLDVSGSMGETCDPYSYLVKVKSLAFYMYKKNIVNDIYFFDSKLYGPFNDIKKVIGFESGGGTNFKIVAENIIQTNRKSLVLTDGDSSGNIPYTHKAYWCGIDPSCKFHCFTRGYYSSESIKYIAKGRVGIYDSQNGITIMKKK